MKNILKFFAVAAVVLATACDKDPDIWQTNTKDINGTWEVTITVDGDTLVSHADGGQVYIYNTNANNDSVWIKENAYLGFTAKVGTNPQALTFQNTDDGILNGVVVKKGVQVQPQYLLGGPIVADSIYFEVLYEDEDDGTVYTLKYSGYRHTGWEAYVE